MMFKQLRSRYLSLEQQQQHILFIVRHFHVNNQNNNWIILGVP